MDRMMKHLTRSRGAVAALVLTAIAPTLGAQETQPARPRTRDSVLVRMFTMPGVPMDSLKVLVRALEREQYGSPDWLAITRRVDSIVAQQRALVSRRLSEERLLPRTQAPFAPTGWLGLLTQGPSQQIIDRTGQHVIYFAHPQIISVDPSSPAERAGITPGDVLIAYNGQDVVNRDFNVTELLQPNRRVSITVRRDGEDKEYSVRVARQPERIVIRRRDLDAPLPAAIRAEPPDPPEAVAGTMVPRPPLIPSAPPTRLFLISPNGMFGATLSTMSPELARVYRVKPGVLANEVPDDSPAWRSGLRTGDVILRVEDAPVLTVNEFRDRVLTHLQQHSVTLQVLRNQKPRTLRLSWPSP